MDDEFWVDFTPEPPKPPKYLCAGSYTCIIVKIEEKHTSSGMRYLQWHLKQLKKYNVHPDFTLFYVSPIKDRSPKLKMVLEAITGKKVKNKILVTPKEYLGVRVKADVNVRTVPFNPSKGLVNEVTRIRKYNGS